MSIRTYAAALFSIVALAATSQAFAGHGFVPDNSDAGGVWHDSPSVLTRDQVRGELQAAVRSGELPRTGGEAMSQTTPRAASVKTREQVKQELRAWMVNPVSRSGYRQINGDMQWIRDDR